MTDATVRLDRARNALNRIIRISVDPDVTRIAERALEEAAIKEADAVAKPFYPTIWLSPVCAKCVDTEEISWCRDNIFEPCDDSECGGAPTEYRAVSSAIAGGLEATSGYLNQPCRTKLDCAIDISINAQDRLPLSADARIAFNQIITLLRDVRR